LGIGPGWGTFIPAKESSPQTKLAHGIAVFTNAELGKAEIGKLK
jgi:hypothetical protein